MDKLWIFACWTTSTAFVWAIDPFTKCCSETHTKFKARSMFENDPMNPQDFAHCKSRVICTAWCSEIGSLTSLDAPELHASGDVNEPISLHQAVFATYPTAFAHPQFSHHVPSYLWHQTVQRLVISRTASIVSANGAMHSPLCVNGVYSFNMATDWTGIRGGGTLAHPRPGRAEAN